MMTVLNLEKIKMALYIYCKDFSAALIHGFFQHFNVTAEKHLTCLSFVFGEELANLLPTPCRTTILKTHQPGKDVQDLWIFPSLGPISCLLGESSGELSDRNVAEICGPEGSPPPGTCIHHRET
jgi:hypothetical protein